MIDCHSETGRERWSAVSKFKNSSHIYSFASNFLKTLHEVIMIRYAEAFSLSLNLTVGFNDVDILNMLGRKCLEHSPPPFML